MHISTVIKKTKEVFACHGILKVVFSDNGPEFDSSECKDFSKRWNFVHGTSSPKFPQSNGQVERTIQTVKRTLIKAAASHQDPYLALLAIPTTPVKGQDKSPAFMFMNRHPRALLPSVKTPKPSRIKKSKSPYRHHYDKGAKDLPPLNKANLLEFTTSLIGPKKELFLIKPLNLDLTYLQLIRAPL